MNDKVEIIITTWTGYFTQRIEVDGIVIKDNCEPAPPDDLREVTGHMLDRDKLLKAIALAREPFSRRQDVTTGLDDEPAYFSDFSLQRKAAAVKHAVNTAKQLGRLQGHLTVAKENPRMPPTRLERAKVAGLESQIADLEAELEELLKGTEQ